MNYFTKKRIITWLVVALTIINISSLITIWMKQHPTAHPPKHQLPADAKEATTQFLKNELEFSDEQVEKFLSLQDQFLKDSQKLRSQLGENKRDLFNELIENRPVDKEMVLANIGRLHSQREKLTYNYFKAVKELCKGHQQRKYKMLVGQILMRMDPGHRPPHRRARRPRLRPGDESQAPDRPHHRPPRPRDKDRDRPPPRR